MVDAMGLHCRNSTGVSEQSIGHDSCHQGFYNLDGLVICKFMEKWNNAIRWYDPKYQRIAKMGSITGVQGRKHRISALLTDVRSWQSYLSVLSLPFLACETEVTMPTMQAP